MKEEENSLYSEKLNSDLEHFKYEVAQELGISHRKGLNEDQPETKREKNTIE